jgi:putative redox protein
MADKTVDIQLDAAMRLVARTGSGHELVMDDSRGDSGPRPTELLLAALGGCTGMDVLSILRKKRLTISRFDVRVAAVQRAAYPQIFTEIDLMVEVAGPDLTVAVVRDAIELSARKYCSVGATIAAGESTIHHRYRVINTGAEPFEETGECRVSGPFTRPEALPA